MATIVRLLVAAFVVTTVAGASCFSSEAGASTGTSCSTSTSTGENESDVFGVLQVKRAPKSKEPTYVDLLETSAGNGGRETSKELSFGGSQGAIDGTQFGRDNKQHIEVLPGNAFTNADLAEQNSLHLVTRAGSGEKVAFQQEIQQEMQRHIVSQGSPGKTPLLVHEIMNKFDILVGGLTMGKAIKMRLDPEALQGDVDKLTKTYGEGGAHYGNANEAGWTMLSLISCTGDVYAQFPCKGGWKPTPAWQESHYMRSVLEPVLPAVQRVRVSLLHPGQEVDWHRDGEIPFQTGQPPKLHSGFSFTKPICRVHLVVSNNPGAHLQLGAEMLQMDPGDIFCGDFSLPHTFWNHGKVVRTSIIVDLMIDEDVLSKSELGRQVLELHSNMVNERDKDGRTRTADWKEMMDFVGGVTIMNGWQQLYNRNPMTSSRVE